MYYFASVKVFFTPFIWNVLAPAYFGRGSWNLTSGTGLCGPFFQVWKSYKHARTLLSSCYWILDSDYPISFWLFFSSINTLLSHLQELSDCAYTKTCRKLMSSSEVGENREIFSCSGLSPNAWTERWESASSVPELPSTSLIKRNYKRVTFLIQICGGFGLEKTWTATKSYRTIRGSRDRNNWLKIDPSQQQSPHSLICSFVHPSRMRNKSEEGKNKWKLPGHKKRQFNKWKKRKPNKWHWVSHLPPPTSRPMPSQSPWKKLLPCSLILLLSMTENDLDYSLCWFGSSVLVMSSPKLAHPSQLPEEQSEKETCPWHCADTAQQLLKCCCIINTVLVTNLKHRIIWDAMMKTDCIPTSTELYWSD